MDLIITITTTKSFFYYLCAESTALRPIADTAECER
jgi:hypothetical protein